MAVKHINENAKEESGILLSDSDSTKVFSMPSIIKKRDFFKLIFM